MAFQKATKKQARLRLALIGPSGSGKTYSALNIAQHLGEKVAVIDTERGSASKYADIFQFDVMELDTFHPQQYINGIKEAGAAGYDALIIDSLSHAWMGKDGALELVDKAAKRSQSGNTFNAWREVTPLHNALVDAILQANMHIIVTMRAKTEYVVETNEKGKQVPRKVGLAPVQRDGLEYEFDVVADLDLDNNMIVSKTRCPALAGALIAKPGEQVAEVLKAWLSDGAPITVTETPAHSQPKVDTNSVSPTPAPAKLAAPAEHPKPAAPKSDEPHPNKTAVTEALCKSIYVAASKLGLSHDQVHNFASEFFKAPNLTSLYDLGKDPQPYKTLLTTFNAKAAERGAQ